MKPNWDDAPEWANYVAMDEDGEWFWFENEPKVQMRGWWAEGRYRLACFALENWEETLEKRP